MFGFYTPVLILQVFCLYQVYTRKEDQKWFFIIFFLPLLGSLFYLYQTFYSKKNVTNLAEGVKSKVINNYKIDQLKKEVSFSDTVANRTSLAEEYINKEEYEKAQSILESCLEGIYKDDVHLLKNLVKVNFLNRNYPKAIELGKQISNEIEFKNSEEKVALAWSYYYNNNTLEAEQTFKEMDMWYSNYNLRLEYAKYLEITGKIDLAIQKLETMLNEISTLNNYEKKLNKNSIRDIKTYHQQFLKK